MSFTINSLTNLESLDYQSYNAETLVKYETIIRSYMKEITENRNTILAKLKPETQPEPETPLPIDQWNQMIAEAEKAAEADTGKAKGGAVQGKDAAIHKALEIIHHLLTRGR